jgi:tetratricopeptide (TPR) repeat protein
LLAAAVLAGAARPDGARAAAPSPAESSVEIGAAPRSISEREAAQLLIQGGRFAEAKRVLVALEAKAPQDSEVQFLLGLIAVQEKHYAEAIHRFRAILVREPGVTRVRLELARAFFLAKDYDNAERQFRLARAGDLSPAAKANVDQYLYLIRQARRWTYNLSAAVVPDTNEGAGPGVNIVDLFGLPFQLSADARQHSGVGMNISAGGEYSPALTKTIRLRIGAQIDTTDYPGGEFNDTTLAAYAGPRFLTQHWDISPLATGFERWFSNRFYNQGVGGSLQATYYATPRLALTGTLGAQQVTYGPPKGQDGPTVSGSLGFLYTLDPLSAITAAMSVSRQDASLGFYANTASQIRLGYARDLPLGYSILIQPSYAGIDYDLAQAAFGVARRDRQSVIQISLLNRRIDFFGFTPRIAYTHTHNASNLALYAYDRDQAQIGLTREF